MCETPPRSPTMVGIAVETMVWSRLDMSMPASRAEKIRLIRRRVSTIGGAAGLGGGGGPGGPPGGRRGGRGAADERGGDARRPRGGGGVRWGGGDAAGRSGVGQRFSRAERAVLRPARPTPGRRGRGTTR